MTPAGKDLPPVVASAFVLAPSTFKLVEESMLLILFAIAIAPTVPTSNTGETVVLALNICNSNLNDLTLDILFVSFIGEATMPGLSM